MFPVSIFGLFSFLRSINKEDDGDGDPSKILFQLDTDIAYISLKSVCPCAPPGQEFNKAVAILQFSVPGTQVSGAHVPGSFLFLFFFVCVFALGLLSSHLKSPDLLKLKKIFISGTLSFLYKPTPIFY